MNDINLLIGRALKGEKPAVSRLISLLERGDQSSQTILEAVFPLSQDAFYIGITGPPGAGKSTLVDKLVTQFCSDNYSVGVIAVDPCSPFTGGALLGDRVRMNSKHEESNCFFRSMSAGKILGGLAQKSKEAAWVLAASGRQVIVIETVGVGQSELDILTATDTVVVVLTPESGDNIQAMKAGLIEIADMFVINKSDRPGADDMRCFLGSMLDRKEQVSGSMAWRPPVYKTSAEKNSGIYELYEGIGLHHKYITENSLLEERREQQYRTELVNGIQEEVKAITMANIIDDQQLRNFSTQMRKEKKDPRSVAKLLTRKIFPDELLACAEKTLDLKNVE
jgi:GTPase